MRANKSTYRELAPLVHESAVLRVQSPVPSPTLRDRRRVARRIGVAAKSTLRFERLRRLVLVVDMEDHAHWDGWLDFFGAVLARAQHLEHLTVDWALTAPAIHPSARGELEAKQDKEKEGEFLDMLCGLAGLQALRFYGQVPEGWIERIKQVSDTQVKSYSFRWWGRPGLN
ncbi:hypothetical protein PG991_001438 [Apiospora marii]|uniref:Uncharacterized protein n=1 Tax=Apiospora marii TaxID=335849 RepID=A0ABR1SS30_9PEZI